ncbi:hypothetical protein MMC30_005183 [Trapelia coarctata]|nr:hypothetical protein [Trapelia coarctata]
MQLGVLAAALLGLLITQGCTAGSHSYRTPPEGSLRRKVLGQRDVDSIDPRSSLDIYERAQDGIYPRDSCTVSEPYGGLSPRNERPFSELFERDFSTPYTAPFHPVHASDKALSPLPLKRAEPLYKGKPRRRNFISERNPAGSSPGSPKPHSPQRPSSPGSDSGSTFATSEGSTDSARLVSMNWIKTSADPNKGVRIVGISGCAAIFLSGTAATGAGFITGAHARPDYASEVADEAAQEAMGYGTVAYIRILTSDPLSARDAETVLRKFFPHVRPRMERYGMPEWDDAMNDMTYEFDARHGSPPRITVREKVTTRRWSDEKYEDLVPGFAHSPPKVWDNCRADRRRGLQGRGKGCGRAKVARVGGKVGRSGSGKGSRQGR